MHLDQMFPKKTLDAEDLGKFAPAGVVVTIEKLDYKTMPSRQFGEPEIVYYLHVLEFKKPFKLNTFNAYAIGDLLQTKDTDQWIRKVIRIRGIQKMGTDQLTGRPRSYWTFDVDMLLPTEPPCLPPKQDISGWAASGQAPRLMPGMTAPQLAAAPAAELGLMSPIGEDAAGDILIALSERGRTLENLIEHFTNMGIDDMVKGKRPPEWPRAILPPARTLCKQLPKCAPPMAPSLVAALKAEWRAPASLTHAAALAAEVIDKKTGEVMTAAAPAPHTPRLVGAGVLPPQKPAAAEYQPINEDDIPF